MVKGFDFNIIIMEIILRA